MIKHTLRYFRKAIFYIQKEGLKAFIVKVFALFKSIAAKVFLYQDCYILQKNLNDELQCFAPKLENYDFKIISTTEELRNLQESGFTINAPFSIRAFYQRLNQGQIAFCVFVKKDLAHSGWAVVNGNVKISPPVKNIDYEKEAFGWGVITAPRYRGLGLYTYEYFKRLEYLKEIGKSRFVGSTLKDNEPSIKTQTKLGVEIYGEGRLLRLFGLVFWKEKSLPSKKY